MSAVNECIPWEEDADRLPAQATAAVTGKTFVRVSAARTSGPLIPATAQVGASDPVDGGRIQVAPAAAAGHALGVASWDAAIGEGLTVLTEGVVPVTAAANIAAGSAVEVAAGGQVTTLAAGIKVGYAVDDVLSGADAQIKLIV